MLPVCLSVCFLYILANVAELDALGDDILLDEDTSYLDSATIPDPPNTVPQTTGGQTDVSRLCLFNVVCCYCCSYCCLEWCITG